MGALQIDVESRTVKIGDGWRPWLVYESLAFGDGQTGRMVGLTTYPVNGQYRGLDPLVYRAFFKAGESTARAAVDDEITADGAR